MNMKMKAMQIRKEQRWGLDILEKMDKKMKN